MTEDRILKMTTDITHQQKIGIKCCGFLLCLGESTHKTGPAHLAIFIHYFVGNNIKKKLISSISLATTTKGIDTCNTVIIC